MDFIPGNDAREDRSARRRAGRNRQLAGLLYYTINILQQEMKILQWRMTAQPAFFKQKINIFRGQFSIISAFVLHFQSKIQQKVRSYIAILLPAQRRNRCQFHIKWPLLKQKIIIFRGNSPLSHSAFLIDRGGSGRFQCAIRGHRGHIWVPPITK